MTGWARRRFWTAAAVEADGAEGFRVVLDGRDVRTPAKAPLRVPTRALAEAIAAEWAAQGDTIDPEAMPVTRAANSAIDKVAPDPAAVVAEVAGFGASDLLCYRADGPGVLVARQAAAWDPLLHWADRALGAPLRVTRGIVHVAQPPESLAALHARVAALDPFGLTALHDLVSTSGSLVIGLRALEPDADIKALWAASRIDEDWQIEQWGEDAEARAAADAREGAFRLAERFYRFGRKG